MEAIAARPSVRSFRYMLHRAVYRLTPAEISLDRPVFIVGCGRSGTTILGEMLAQHQELAYLNEPFEIWSYEPRTDIWSEQALSKNARLRLTAEDVTPRVGSHIKHAFAVEMHRQNADKLVEKTPINSFRVGFIDGLFPDALFVHLIRNGGEVAHSIAKRAKFGLWFEGAKWQLLADCARERGEGDLVDLCTDDLCRGMLEWRLSVSTAMESLHNLPAQRSLEIRYENLLQDPSTICETLESFMGIDPSAEMHRFAATTVKRKSPPVDASRLTPAMLRIGGDLLAQLGYKLATS